MIKFKPIYRIAARRALLSGTIKREEYDKVMETLRWPIRVHKGTKEKVYVLNKIQEYVYGSMKQSGLTIDWDNILEWLKDHWVDILKVIVSILIILEPPPKEK